MCMFHLNHLLRSKYAAGASFAIYYRDDEGYLPKESELLNL